MKWLIDWLQRTVGVGTYRTLRVRPLVQLGFAIGSLIIGLQFRAFILAARRGELPLPPRPAGVEGYLPISGLMGLIDWIYRGTLNTIHPAATLLLLIFLGMSLILRRSFCAWICPVGFASETFARLGQRLIGRNLRLPFWLDRGLRAVRYLLLGFFVWAIFTMSATALREFLQSDYNQVADVKMYLFFADIGPAALIVVIGLAIGSIFINGLWCRYLCPYGALIGLFGALSPFRIRRDRGRCIDCGICDKVCMGRIDISRRGAVSSLECTGCLDCVASCPVPETLEFSARRRRLGGLAMACAVLLLFFGGYLASRVSGHWDTEITDGEFIQHISRMDSHDYSHPGASGRYR